MVGEHATDPLSAALRSRPFLVGGGCMIPSPFVAELVAWSGCDYVSVDQQHGVMDNPVLLSMFQGIEARGAIPITRVPTGAEDVITRALDIGARGVIVPLVETVEQVERAVAACRYPPRGTRSFGPVRAQVVCSSTDADDLEAVALIALVETSAGLERVDEIAAVPGLTGIYVGPNDLALSLGLDRDVPWPPVSTFRAALVTIVDACKRHNVIPGIGVGGSAAALACRMLGFRMIGIGYDVNHLAAAMRRECGTLRDGAAQAVAP
jgi:4-hydroxy-2-oxoheptanedioate aldolase